MKKSKFQAFKRLQHKLYHHQQTCLFCGKVLPVDFDYRDLVDTTLASAGGCLPPVAEEKANVKSAIIAQSLSPAAARRTPCDKWITVEV